MVDRQAPKADFRRLILPVSNLDASAEFYGRIVGLAEIAAAWGEEGRWFQCANGVILELEPADPGESPARPSRLTLRVDDLAGIRSRLEKSGRLATADAKGERVVGKDPDGNRLEFLEGRGVAPGMISRSRLDGRRFRLEESIRLPAPPELVWNAFVDHSILSAWLCGGPALVNPRPGGRLLLTFPHLGRPHSTWNCVIVEFIPPARLSFKEEELGIEVTFDLAPTKSGGALLRASQAPYDLSDHPGDPARVAQDIALTWRRILRRLQLYLEDELEPEGPGDGAGGSGA